MSVPCTGESSTPIVEHRPICLSGEKPFFDVILKWSHVHFPFRMSVPAHAVPLVPRVNLVAVLCHGDKVWNLAFCGKDKYPRFEFSDWKTFVDDNTLKCDDACIFEVLESSNEVLMFNVLIIRNTAWLPPDLLAPGTTLETLIVVDQDEI